VTGTATSVSALVVLALGDRARRRRDTRCRRPRSRSGCSSPGGLWFLAGTLFLRLVEADGATEGGVDGVAGCDLPISAYFAATLSSAVRRDPFAPDGDCDRPALSPDADRLGRTGLGSLGPFVVASSIATILGGRLWGRLSDRSSRRVLVGRPPARVLFAARGDGAACWPRDLLAEVWVAAALLFLVVLAYQGVRLGRATHLVDMADGRRIGPSTPRCRTRWSES
jgi:hypothetical protein